MASLPEPPETKSSPAPACKTSLPAPPSRISAPPSPSPPPKSVSSPMPPTSVSEPLPPPKQSLPLPLSMESCPASPCTVSLPEFLWPQVPGQVSLFRHKIVSIPSITKTPQTLSSTPTPALQSMVRYPALHLSASLRAKRHRFPVWWNRRSFLLRLTVPGVGGKAGITRLYSA